jgi:hypothetical protein
LSDRIPRGCSRAKLSCGVCTSTVCLRREKTSWITCWLCYLPTSWSGGCRLWCSSSAWQSPSIMRVSSSDSAISGMTDSYALDHTVLYYTILYYTVSGRDPRRPRIFKSVLHMGMYLGIVHRKVWRCQTNEWRCQTNEWRCQTNEWRCQTNEWRCQTN